MKPIDTGKKIFSDEIEELQKVMDRLNNDFNKAIEIISNIKGKVVVTGIGKSGIIGKKIAATLASTGTQAVFMNSAEGLHGDLGMIGSDDAVIAISNSGNSDEIISILPAINEIGAKVIALTGNLNSKLAKASDIILDIGVENEACPINLAPMASTTATLIMGDAIAAALMKEKNFRPESFALYHPGGSLGRRLLLRVRDVMHKGDSIPIISKESGIERVLIEIGKKKMGAVCIVENDSLIGIITEGDIRRALRNREKFFELKAKDLMTKDPATIDENKMAVDALKIMEDRESQISELPVMKENKLVGIVRIHDLLGKFN